jgi:hypothetical protein
VAHYCVFSSNIIFELEFIWKWKRRKQQSTSSVERRGGFNCNDSHCVSGLPWRSSPWSCPAPLVCSQHPFVTLMRTTQYQPPATITYSLVVHMSMLSPTQGEAFPRFSSRSNPSSQHSKG